MEQPAASGRLALAVLGGAAILLLAGLGGVDANTPDEPRYLQVAEELRSGAHGASGLVLLHLNGEPYLEKPPLYFWSAALLGAPFDRVTELAARLPSALAGLGVVALTLLLGRRLFGGASGVLGAALLATVYEFAENARRIQLDVLLALFETGALVAFWRLDRRLARRPRALLAGLHVAMGLAVLTKGPVGFLIPLLVMAAYLAWEGRLRELARYLPPWGLALSLGPGLLWMAAAAALGPEGFLAHTVGPNLLGRFFAGSSHPRPFYYYLYHLPGDFLPWTLLFPVVAWAAARRVFGAQAAPRPETQRAWRFLLAWAGASLVFFSVSSGKRGLYLLPAYPAIALLCGDAVVRQLAGHTRPPRGYGVGAALLALVLAALGLEAALAGLADAPLVLDPAWVETLRGGLLGAFGLALLGVLAAGVGGWLFLLRARASVLAFPAVAVTTAFGALLCVFLLLYPALEPILTLRPLAEAAAEHTPPDEPVGLLRDETWIGGITYYGRRPVALLESTEDVRRFLERGGDAIVLQTSRLEHVRAASPVEVVARARSGRREALVVVPRGEARERDEAVGSSPQGRDGSARSCTAPTRAPTAPGRALLSRGEGIG